MRRNIMKQKYTLSIADMEINVITDEPQESVEYIVGILDRKMREIALKSKRCSRNEAALLCALDFCADKVKAKEQIEELEEQVGDSLESIRNLNEKLEYAKSSAERLEKERARLEVENSKLRSLLDDVRAGKEITSADIKNIETAEVETDAPVEDSADAEKKEEKAPVQKKKNASKSRVGSMFDLLTFSDI